MVDKTSVRVTAIASVAAVLILTIGVASIAVAYPNHAKGSRQVVPAQAVTQQAGSLESSNLSAEERRIAWLKAEAEDEARDAAEDKAEADYKAKIGDPEAAEDAFEAKESAREAAAAKKAYEDALAAQKQNAPAKEQQSAPTPAPAPQASIPAPQPSAPAAAPSGGSKYGDDYYKQENGTVYEWDDDGYWEPEADKKIDNGVVYEYDDGRWEADKKVENGVAYEWDDGRWEADYDDDWDDDRDDWDD